MATADQPQSQANPNSDVYAEFMRRRALAAGQPGPTDVPASQVTQGWNALPNIGPQLAGAQPPADMASAASVVANMPQQAALTAGAPRLPWQPPAGYSPMAQGPPSVLRQGWGGYGNYTQSGPGEESFLPYVQPGTMTGREFGDRLNMGMFNDPSQINASDLSLYLRGTPGSGSLADTPEARAATFKGMMDLSRTSQGQQEQNRLMTLGMGNLGVSQGQLQNEVRKTSDIIDQKKQNTALTTIQGMAAQGRFLTPEQKDQLLTDIDDTGQLRQGSSFAPYGPSGAAGGGGGASTSADVVRQQQRDRGFAGDKYKEIRQALANATQRTGKGAGDPDTIAEASNSLGPDFIKNNWTAFHDYMTKASGGPGAATMNTFMGGGDISLGGPSSAQQSARRAIAAAAGKTAGQFRQPSIAAKLASVPAQTINNVLYNWPSAAFQGIGSALQGPADWLRQRLGRDQE